MLGLSISLGFISGIGISYLYDQFFRKDEPHPKCVTSYCDHWRDVRCGSGLCTSHCQMYCEFKCTPAALTNTESRGPRLVK
jgi:hypothetical protein